MSANRNLLLTNFGGSMDWSEPLDDAGISSGRGQIVVDTRNNRTAPADLETEYPRQVTVITRDYMFEGIMVSHGSVVERD